MTENGSYYSSNHYKYTVDNRLYQYHVQKVTQRTYEMVAATTPQTVLDAGCGEGFVSNYMKEQDPTLDITGVDLSKDAIEYARNHFGSKARFMTGDLFDLPFEDDSFDTVLCSEVLEHLSEPEVAAQELRRVARNHVVITVPREPYFQWLNDAGQLLGLNPDPGHVNFWTKESFQKFIREQFGRGEFDWKHIYQLAITPA